MRLSLECTMIYAVMCIIVGMRTYQNKIAKSNRHRYQNIFMKDDFLGEIVIKDELLILCTSKKTEAVNTITSSPKRILSPSFSLLVPVRFISST